MAIRTLGVSADEGAAQLRKGFRGGFGDTGVVGPLQVDDLFREPTLVVLADEAKQLATIAAVPPMLHRPADRGRISAGRLARRVEHPTLLGPPLRGPPAPAQMGGCGF